MSSLTDTDWLLATWQLQVAVGSGYTAYMIAYTGIRSHHQSIDTTFRTIAFSVVSTAIMLSLSDVQRTALILIAFGGTVTAGVLWRRFGMDLWEATLRFLDVTWADDTPSAWARMSADQAHHITQLSVLTIDGVRLRCHDASTCGDLPLGPCVLGTNGDLLLYVTHIKRPGEEEKESVHMCNTTHGARMTYLPASSIKELQVRRKPVQRKGPIKRLRSFFNRRLQAAMARDPAQS
jgi:hypothetical protein